MKFTGELKFPEIDHPGVPVQFVIEDTQTELLVEGESLGRWSLYDVRARRLVASAFQIELDGTEVTFVADDPIDFAYRGVEHMAETWATLKSKRMASRPIAVRKSRRGTTPSRIEDMKAAMLSNLEGQSGPRQIAGEVVMPGTQPAVEQGPADDADWDRREHGSIPVVGEDADHVEEAGTRDLAGGPDVSEQLQRLEEEKRRLAAEWDRLDEERRLAERREEDRIEAYRLEMERLRAEREQLQLLIAAQQEPEPVEAGIVAESDPVEEEVAAEAEPVQQEAAEPPEQVDEEVAAEAEPVEEEAAEEPEPEVVSSSAEAGVLDLKDLEGDVDAPPEREAEPEPVAAGPVTTSPRAGSTVGSRERSGLMGAVRSAFRAGSKDHAHQFIEAPGGIGITRYVCEECGYVSISA